MRPRLSKIARSVAIVSAATALLVGPVVTSATATAAPVPAGVVAPASAGDGTPAGAVAWYKAHIGSTGWEHYCEKAAENSYGTSGVWASAIAHWNGASPKHRGDTNPPAGSFVYWNISAYGHVGISDGAGGFYATSVHGAIGHVTKAQGGYGYFTNYLGWTPGDRPRP